MIGDVSYSGAMSALCFLVCLLAVAVSLLSNRLVAGIDRERRAEHEHMTLERLEAQMAQHQQQIDNINKLSHDMRNHLATLAAMGGSKEAADYIAALTHRFAPVAVRKISGCPVLDVLLSQKMDECSRVGASLIPCISQEAIGALCALSGPDLCTLYGNLLDNAIEAVSALPDGEDKTVTLRTNLRGNLLVIRTENRYQGERRHAGGGFSTTKADANAHGYGLRRPSGRRNDAFRRKPSVCRQCAASRRRGLKRLDVPIRHEKRPTAQNPFSFQMRRDNLFTNAGKTSSPLSQKKKKGYFFHEEHEDCAQRRARFRHDLWRGDGQRRDLLRLRQGLWRRRDGHCYR